MATASICARSIICPQSPNDCRTPLSRAASAVLLAELPAKATTSQRLSSRNAGSSTCRPKFVPTMPIRITTAPGSVLRWLQRHRLRRSPQERGGESIAEPAQIGRGPFQHPEPARAVLALVPDRRHLGDGPAEPMRLHQQFDAVGEALVGFDGDAFDDAAGEQAE